MLPVELGGLGRAPVSWGISFPYTFLLFQQVFDVV